MQLEALIGVLEQSFELDELKRLGYTVLGLEPQEIGGEALRASFARSFAESAVRDGGVEALLDALVVADIELPRELQNVRKRGFFPDEELTPGETVGAFTIIKTLNRGRIGIDYLARASGQEVRLKILRSHAARDVEGVHRYFLINRLAAALTVPGLPRNVVAGVLNEPLKRHFLAHDHVEGELLVERLERTGPESLPVLKPLLQAILRPLAGLHSRGLAHGCLSLANIVVGSDGAGTPSAFLLNLGANSVRATSPLLNGESQRLATIGSPETISPEQVRGLEAGPASDVYSFGAVLYQLLSGYPLFDDAEVLEILLGHLTREPEAVSQVAPRGTIGPAIDDFVRSLIDKQPERRPRDAVVLNDSFEGLARASMVPRPISISSEEVAERLERLAQNTWDEALAVEVEGAVNLGADPRQIAEGFSGIAEQLDPDDGPALARARRRMLFRAARLYETAVDEPALAEEIYEGLVNSDPDDPSAQSALERLRRKLGKFEAVVEHLLGETERAVTGAEKGRLFAKIGEVYFKDLKEREQALVAYVQAFCEDPENRDYVSLIERLAGADHRAWEEVLGNATQATETDLPLDDKNQLMLQIAHWYATKLSRPDLALPWYNQIVSVDPAHAEALAGLGALYRRAQQWGELANTLLRRAEVASPTEARGLRTEAAEIVETRLNNRAGAREIYERVLADDPGHEAASAALARIHEANADWLSYVRVLENRAGALSGERRSQVLCQVAEIYEHKLNNPIEAKNRYEAVLEAEPTSLEALRGVERALERAGRYVELLTNLRRQIELAVTPRQKLQLWERVATIYDEEFLDHARSAEALEELLELDATHERALNELERQYRMLERYEDLVRIYEHDISVSAAPARRIEKLLALGRVLGESLRRPARAIAVFEQVLTLAPENAVALEALAGLETRSGDADRALRAIETLAESSNSAHERAEQYARAAQLLESSGDLVGAIGRYKLAVDANPGDSQLARRLREAYVANQEYLAAAELLAREVALASGDRARAQLIGETARLHYEQLKDPEAAASFAHEALELDPTELGAALVLGHLAVDAGQPEEAAKRYEHVVGQRQLLDAETRFRVLVAYGEALQKAGTRERANLVARQLLEEYPDEVQALAAAAQLVFDNGEPAQAMELYRRLLSQFSESLSLPQQADAYYRLGEAARRAGDLEQAFSMLSQAIDLDTTAQAPLEALEKVHEARAEWDEVIRILYARLDSAKGDLRAELLMRVADVAASQLQDTHYAAESYLAALAERPKDRKILMKLMQLYSNSKDWRELVSVVLELAELVEDAKQRARYLHTAAHVSVRELGDVPRAIALVDAALALDPRLDIAIELALELKSSVGNLEGVKDLLKLRITSASDKNDQEQLLETLDRLRETYLGLGRLEQAVAVCESSVPVEGASFDRRLLLAQLYIRDVRRYFDKVVDLLRELIDEDPFRPEAFKLLRQVYTEARRPDGAWCVCQALTVLNRAEPDEVRFFSRMKSDDAAAAQDRLNEEDWENHVRHRELDVHLSAFFRLIQPAVVAQRAQDLAALGYTQEHLIDSTQYPYGIVYSVHYACDILGVPQPPMFQNTNDPGALAFLHAAVPSIVVGQYAFEADVPAQVAAALAARHLTYFRPGYYLRQLIPTATGLKAWLFAAIKLITPQFPVGAELEGPVNDAGMALATHITGAARDHLATLVHRLLQQGASLDLRRWMNAVDLTADRAALVLGNDLEKVLETIQSSADPALALPAAERIKELIAYAVSPDYLAIRERLQIGVG